MSQVFDFPHKGNRGGGDSSGQPPHNEVMESRVSKLEDFAVETRERLARVETKLDHIDKEVSNFKWWVVAQIVAGLLAVLGTGIAIQQMTVASFQGAAQVAKDAAPPAPAQQPIIINVPQGYELGNGKQTPPAKP
ncbi:hypothetical protein C8C99_0285 [Acidovorax sp. 107]|uniref:hypothetical protein n=1 Tax=Acidovorax sp. 107 TaxID=2135638 RepID=UPI000D4FD5B9|nr:hypothetical protein [Acidovorax sp. 107]PUA95485.1 hypothetical protein C8C99_0285 [Acidovorax sp. 107]